MNDFAALDLSGAGMSAQRERMRVVAENLANQHTTGPNGPYRRKEVILQSTPLVEFESELNAAVAGGEAPVQTVETQSIRYDNAPPIRVYEPNHPHADAEGYVSYPNISIFREMTDMIEASRSYEANMAAAKTTQDMLIASLDLVRR